MSDNEKNEPVQTKQEEETPAPATTNNEPVQEEEVKKVEEQQEDNGPQITLFSGSLDDPRADPTLKTQGENADGNYQSLVDAVAAKKKREKILDSVGIVDAVDEQERIVAREARKRELAMSHPIPISFVTKSISDKFRERKLNNEFFLYVPFLIAFLFFFVIGRDVESGYWAGAQLGGQAAESELPPKEQFWGLKNGEVETNHVRKTFVDVKTPDEWHLWLQSNIISFFWQGGVDRNPKASVVQNNYIEGGNLKVGAMRIRQLRVNDDSCVWNENFMNESLHKSASASHGLNSTGGDAAESGVTANPCWGELSFVSNPESLNKSDIHAGQNNYTYEDCKFTARMMEGSIGFYPCGGNVFDIPYSYSQEKAIAMADTLRAEKNSAGMDFIDLRATRFIIVELMVYHPATDQFTTVKCLTEISQGGKFINTVRTETFQIWTKNLTGHTAYFLCFFILAVFPFIFKWIFDLIMMAKSGRCFEYLFNVWNILEFANLVVFCIVFIVRNIWWEKSEELNFHLPGGDEYRQEVDYISWLYLLQVYFNAFNTIAIFLKIMKYIELNPRLNLISRTMSHASSNLVGVLIIFLLIVVSYALTGVMLFSNGMEQFRDMEYSFSSLMRILIGDFDYPAMREENIVLAGFYFWSFNLLGLFLMLNFIIGVISASFNEEYSKTRVEPLHESLTRFTTDIKIFIMGFIRAPISTVLGSIEKRKTKFGESGRLTCVLRTIEDFRMSLNSGMTREQLMQLDRETRFSMLPDPSVTREDLNLMFVEIMGDVEAEENLAWLTETYVDALWLEIHRQFKLAPDEDEANAIEEVCEHIQAATEHSLKWVLGLETAANNNRKPDAEVAKIQELFAPGAENLRKINEMQERLNATETSMAGILKTLQKLDSTMDSLL